MTGGRLESAFIFTTSNTNVVEEYHPATGQWGRAKAKMPTEQSGGARALHKGRIYVAGGERQDNYLMAAFPGVETSDPASNSREGLPHMPLPRDGLAGAIVGAPLHFASGDIQSADVTAMRVVTESHGIFEFGQR